MHTTLRYPFLLQKRGDSLTLFSSELASPSRPRTLVNQQLIFGAMWHLDLDYAIWSILLLSDSGQALMDVHDQSFHSSI